MNKIVMLIICVCLEHIAISNKELTFYPKVDKREVRLDTCTKKIKISDLPFDTSINNKYFLGNQRSFSFAKKYSVSYVEHIKEFPVYCFFNSDSTEYFLGFQYEGDVLFQFSGFEIAKMNNFILKKPHICLPDVCFQTTNGIKLGMSINSLRGLFKNTKCKLNIDTDTLISYSLADYKNSDFLKRNKVPSYFIKCILVNGYVFKISFGFDYP